MIIIVEFTNLLASALSATFKCLGPFCKNRKSLASDLVGPHYCKGPFTNYVRKFCRILSPLLAFVCKIPLLARRTRPKGWTKVCQTRTRRTVRARVPSFIKLRLRTKPATRLTLYIGDMSTKNLENRLPFELQCWSTTHFEGFVELSALPLYLKRFCGNMVYLKSCCKT